MLLYPVSITYCLSDSVTKRTAPETSLHLQEAPACRKMMNEMIFFGVAWSKLCPQHPAKRVRTAASVNHVRYCKKCDIFLHHYPAQSEHPIGKSLEIFGTHGKNTNLNLLIVWPTKLGGCLRLVPSLMGFFIHSRLHHPRDFC